MRGIAIELLDPERVGVRTPVKNLIANSTLCRAMCCSRVESVSAASFIHRR